MRPASTGALFLLGLGVGLYGIVSASHIQVPIRQEATIHSAKTGVVAASAKLGSTNPSDGSATSADTVSVASVPISIAVPALGISSNMGPARGVNSRSTIAERHHLGPTWSLPWWYEAGSIPGQAGSAVILGDVGSVHGTGHIGVFFRLGDAKPGEDITVTLTKGLVTSWDITEIHHYSDKNFPDALIDEHLGPPTLRLVTCGGTFGSQTHTCQWAVVVTAVPAHHLSGEVQPNHDAGRLHGGTSVNP